MGCGSRAVYCPDLVVALPGELRAPGLVSWKRDSASPGVILLSLILLRFWGWRLHEQTNKACPAPRFSAERRNWGQTREALPALGELSGQDLLPLHAGAALPLENLCLRLLCRGGTGPMDPGRSYDL